MSYSRSPPLSPSSSQDDWLRGNSKTFSTNSSRSMSRSQSLASASSRAHNSAHYEGNARIYYTELKIYLRDLLAQEAIDGPHPHRVTARQKLTKLSNLQFHELAMDVYDETVRRNKNDKFLPFLMVKEEFHPKRNQARQKLGTLPVARFQDLASDVFVELTRRYPQFIEANGNYSPPPIPQIPANSYANDSHALPKKSINIIPVKGTMNVEDITDDAASVTSPNLMTRSPVSPVKDPKDYFSRSTPNELKPYNNVNNGMDIEKMKSEYEYQISSMSKKIKQLQNRIEELQQQKTSSSKDRDLIDDFKRRNSEDQNTISQLEDKYQEISDKYESLSRDYTQQQEAVRNVKNETKHMLEELKKLAQVHEDLIADKEQADLKIEKLKEEVKEWQTKYEKSRIEIRSLKASSVINSDPIIKENFLQTTRDGIIPKDYIFTYQAYIEELLNEARSTDPTQVIHVMKSIVTVCRSITEEIEKREDTLSTDKKNSLYEMKTRFSTSLSDLLTAAKHHASGMGLSPVSLLDRTAGHLTYVIIELAKLLGMNSTVADIPKSKTNISALLSSLNDESSYKNKKSDNFGYYGTSFLSRSPSSNHKSAHSVGSDDMKFPRSRIDSYSYKNNDNNSYYGKNRQDTNQLTPIELVKYLKKETDNIVETIQNLLAALRLPQQNGEAHRIIAALLKIIATISELSKATCEGTQGYPYKKECFPLLNELGGCSQRISKLQEQYFTKGATATASAKRDLAKEAYEIAKFTKELIALFES